MTDLAFIQEASKKYNVEVSKVIYCLKTAIAKSGNYGEISDEIRNERLYFYESFYNRFNQKRTKQIKITRYNYQNILDEFINNLIEASNMQKYELTRIKAHSKIIMGQIMQIKQNGLSVLTELGYAFAPNDYLFIKDIKSGHYQIGKKMFFCIKSYRKNKLKVKITLGRIHEKVDLAEAQNTLSDCGVFSTQRIFGKEVKVYCAKKPNKEQMRVLARKLNEKIRIELRR